MKVGWELLVVGWEWENGSEDRAMLAARSKHVVLLVQEEFSTQTGMLTPSREHGTKMREDAERRSRPADRQRAPESALPRGDALADMAQD